ncbi:MAG: metal ABC transporter permease [Micavibrio aeruginosavorus]|uniref:Metal ABC transporter permease n=1 Tax=Micavibrio aeruginosavorus TaxID=349221 RepID=A0A7T5R4R3_9BACT|nr:MAG: metal ABC transporter permease [Micavibrio aeruginosavorus]
MLGLMAPALTAGVMVSALHVPLGQEVLRRGIIFIDLAIAQIAALGVVIGKTLLHVEEGWEVFIPAIGFALGGSFLFAWLEKRVPEHQEALIGCAFVLAASLILILLANDPHGGEAVEGLLAGQILWVDWMQIGQTALVYAASLTAWFLLPHRRRVLFYGLFPVVVTLSVQLVGVYLVFASLIMPALGAARFRGRHQLAGGYFISFSALGLGLLFSVVADLPAGPTLVCALAALSAAGGLLPERKMTCK